MNTSQSLIQGNDPQPTVPDQPSDHRALRRLLVIAAVLVAIGLIVFAGVSGLAADPMTGT
jgi:hypothetical protein